MRIIDLHCYPNTEPWITSQGPYVEALAKYWNRVWTWKSEAEVIEEFKQAGVEAMLVAFDIESVTGAPPIRSKALRRSRTQKGRSKNQSFSVFTSIRSWATSPSTSANFIHFGRL